MAHNGKWPDHEECDKRIAELEAENGRLMGVLDSAEREFFAWFVQPSVERVGNLFEPGDEPDNAAGRGLRILRAHQT